MTDSTQSPIWRTHPNHLTIEVSSHGEVRSLAYVDGRGNHRRARPRRVYHDSHGYPVLKVDRRLRKVHHLVLEAFVGPCPDGMEALHRDNDPANPALSNLRWGTRSENSRQRVADGHDAQARRAECLRGHPFSGANLAVSSSGWRRCRQCGAERSWLQNNPHHPDHARRAAEFEALLS